MKNVTMIAPDFAQFRTIDDGSSILELFIYFASDAVAVDSSHSQVTASSSASWSPPSNFVNGHVSSAILE